MLLEAGPDYSDLESLADEMKVGHTQDAELRDAHLKPGAGAPACVQGKVGGGSEAINGQLPLRGIREDYDRWAECGNDEWPYLRVLPFFSKTDTDMDIRDDFRGTEGQVPVLRHNDQEWTPIQSMLYRGAVAAGFREDPDMNGPESSGVFTLPLDKSEGISMSAES